VRELTCAECGATFYPVTPAWGDQTCGDCIAARIERSMLPLALRAERKPMRRAAQNLEPVQATPADFRKTG
jgi:hypothetical protein